MEEKITKKYMWPEWILGVQGCGYNYKVNNRSALFSSIRVLNAADALK